MSLFPAYTVVTVSFDETVYTVQESGSVDVTLQLDKGIAVPFSMIVQPGTRM